LFENIVGNESAKKYLQKTIELGNASHSYMFVGKAGIGKKLIATEYAKNLMCLEGGKCRANSKNDTISNQKNNGGRGDKESSNMCDSCIKFIGGNNPDFVLIEPDGNQIKIKQMRDMQDKVLEKPIVSNRKIYVINDADKMTTEAQNSLLKTLEEPVGYVTIILIVENENMMLPTIKSRCISVKFNKLTADEIKEVYPNASDEIVEILDGSLKNVEAVIAREDDYKSVKKIVDEINKKTLPEVMNDAEVLYKDKENIKEYLEYMNILFFKNGMYDAVNYVEKTKQKITMNNNYEMSIDYLLMNAWKVSNKK